MKDARNEKRPVNKRAVVKIVIWSAVFLLLGLILLGSVTGIRTEIDVIGLPGVHLNLGGFTYEDADEYTVGDVTISDTVSDLEVNWLAGNVTIIQSIIPAPLILRSLVISAIVTAIISLYFIS